MDLPEEQVKVKISTCPKCEGMVRCAVEHKMDKDSEKDFYKEVTKYKLNVKTILPYQKYHLFLNAIHFLLQLFYYQAIMKSWKI